MKTISKCYIKDPLKFNFKEENSVFLKLLDKQNNWKSIVIREVKIYSLNPFTRHSKKTYQTNLNGYKVILN